MTAVEVSYDETMPEPVVAGVLRRLADRLDPPVVRRDLSALVQGVVFDSSSAGTLAVCRVCSWRGGPFTQRPEAVSAARSHRSRCRKGDMT